MSDGDELLNPNIQTTDTALYVSSVRRNRTQLFHLPVSGDTLIPVQDMPDFEEDDLYTKLNKRLQKARETNVRDREAEQLWDENLSSILAEDRTNGGFTLVGETVVQNVMGSSVFSATIDKFPKYCEDRKIKCDRSDCWYLMPRRFHSVSGYHKCPSGQLTESDGYFYYWQAQLISEHGKLPERDMNRWLPLGRDLTQTLNLYGYVLAYVHKGIAWVLWKIVYLRNHIQ